MDDQCRDLPADQRAEEAHADGLHRQPLGHHGLHLQRRHLRAHAPGEVDLEWGLKRRLVDMKLGRQLKGHKGQAGWLA